MDSHLVLPKDLCSLWHNNIPFCLTAKKIYILVIYSSQQMRSKIMVRGGGGIPTQLMTSILKNICFLDNLVPSMHCSSKQFSNGTILKNMKILRCAADKSGNMAIFFVTIFFSKFCHLNTICSGNAYLVPNCSRK